VLASIAPEGSPNADALAQMARSFEAASGGLLRIHLRLGGVVADEQTTLELCQQGRVQIWAGSMGALAATIPALGVFETPYLFEDVAAFRGATRPDVLRQTGVHADFRQRGLEPLGVAFIGWRSMSSATRAIRTPEDMRGMRVRAQSVPLHRAMWKRLGVKIKETALNDVSTAFEQKEVEATDLPGLYVYATSIASRIKFFTRTNHMLQAGMVVFSRQAFDALPKKLQASLSALRVEVATSNTLVNERFEAEVLDLLRKEGAQIIEPTSAERDRWRNALAPLRVEAARLSGPRGAALLRALSLRNDTAVP
jgi:TRAP-type C4-dicarboxylate transport system substrate-binding protein